MKNIIQVEGILNFTDGTRWDLRGVYAKEKESSFMRYCLAVKRYSMNRRQAEYYGRDSWEIIKNVIAPVDSSCKAGIRVE